MQVAKGAVAARILLVEDEAKTALALREGLSADGYQVEVAYTGNEGLDRISTGKFDLVVLDWMLPGRDGLSILHEMRARSPEPPVLLLTARDAVEHRVQGLDSGADDYLPKPFALVELLARVRVLLRRKGPEEPLRHRIGDLLIDTASRRVTRGAQDIALTLREFDLLIYLSRHAGQVVTRQMIAREVWQELRRVTPLDNVIDVHVAHLRKKLDAGRAYSLIQTVRGVGFKLIDGQPT